MCAIDCLEQVDRNLGKFQRQSIVSLVAIVGLNTLAKLSPIIHNGRRNHNYSLIRYAIHHNYELTNLKNGKFVSRLQMADDVTHAALGTGRLLPLPHVQNVERNCN